MFNLKNKVIVITGGAGRIGSAFVEAIIQQKGIAIIAELDIPKAKKLNLLTIISTHSLEEVKDAKNLGADIVTYSPIFSTPNKGIAKGAEELNLVVDSCNIKVIALGGIVTQEQIDEVKNCNVYGFASIRYFNQYRG